MTKWGFDQEERAACTKKAQDAYALSRQAMEKIVALESAIVSIRGEMLSLRGELADSRADHAALKVRMDYLVKSFSPAAKPVVRARRAA